MKTIAMAVLALAAPVLTSACGESAEAREARGSTSDAFDALKNLAVKTWDDLAKQAEPQLQDAREKLAKLEAEVRKRGSGVSADATRMVEQLKKQIATVEERVKNAGSAGSESASKAWTNITDGLGNAGQSIEAAWKALGESK